MTSLPSAQPLYNDPRLSPELNAAASLHADYSAKLIEHEKRLRVAKDKAGVLVQQLQDLDDLMQEVPDIEPPAGMGSFTGGDRVIAAAYELANDTSGHIPTATRELRAFLEEVREHLGGFDRAPPQDSDPDKKFEKDAAQAILTNVENGVEFMEAQAQQLETLKGFFKDIIYC